MVRSKFATGDEQERDWTRPTARLPKFWSFSRYDAWSRCNLRYALAHIWKLKTPPNFAMSRGSEIHKESEDYVDGTKRGIPKSLMQFRSEYAAIRKLGARAELSYTVTKTWQTTTFDDWDHAWLRAKVDIEIPPHGDSFAKDTLTIIDVKTGKPYPKTHDVQADIYGTLGFIEWPSATEIDFEYWYVDSGEVTPYHYTREGLRERKQAWKAKVRPMLAMRKFEAQPTRSTCEYCDFRSDKKLADGSEGPCHAWKAAKN